MRSSVYLPLTQVLAPLRWDSYMLIDFGEKNIFAEHFILLVSTLSCSRCINDTTAGGNYLNSKKKKLFAEAFYQAQVLLEHCQVPTRHHSLQVTFRCHFNLLIMLFRKYLCVCVHICTSMFVKGYYKQF